MVDYKEFEKVATEYKLKSEGELKDRSTAYKINAFVGKVSISLCKSLLIVGAMTALKISSPQYYFLALASAGAYVISEVVSMYQAYKLEKLMQAEYIEFMKFMDAKGFTISGDSVKINKDKN